MEIREFESADEDAVVALWRAGDLTRAWNNPRRDIQRKVAVHDGLFLVGVDHGSVVATVMAGYEGHRGWINYLAVQRGYQNRGFGRMLMREAEHRLTALQCPKINLQVRTTNAEAVAFYDRLGYTVDDVISLGKRLEADTPPGARTDPC